MIKESVVLVRRLLIMVNQRMSIMSLEVACLSLSLCLSLFFCMCVCVWYNMESVFLSCTGHTPHVICGLDILWSTVHILFVHQSSQFESICAKFMKRAFISFQLTYFCITVLKTSSAVLRKQHFLI